MKKIIFTVAIIATAAIAGWNYQQNKQSVELSDLALENVEALARDEGGFNCFWEDRNYTICNNGFGLGCPCGM